MPSAQFDAVVAALRDRERPETPPTLEETRAGFEEGFSIFPVPDGVEVTPVDAGGAAAELLVPPTVDGERTVIYLHGGGYMLGSLNTHRHLAAALAVAARAKVLNVDYRLSPEHPFPAGLDDAMAAYRWHLGSGGSAERTVVAGDSAGGGLAMAALLRLRDEGDPLPAGGVGISPWLDLTCTAASYDERAHLDPMLQRDFLTPMTQAYLAGGDVRHPYASPLFGDPSELPPLLLQVGTAEVLHDDAARFADKATDAGVDVTFEPWDGMCHVWHLYVGVVPESQDGVDRVGEWVRDRTG